MRANAKYLESGLRIEESRFWGLKRETDVRLSPKEFVTSAVEVEEEASAVVVSTSDVPSSWPSASQGNLEKENYYENPTLTARDEGG